MAERVQRQSDAEPDRPDREADEGGSASEEWEPPAKKKKKINKILDWIEVKPWNRTDHSEKDIEAQPIRRYHGITKPRTGFFTCGLCSCGINPCQSAAGSVPSIKYLPCKGAFNGNFPFTHKAISPSLLANTKFCAGAE